MATNDEDNSEISQNGLFRPHLLHLASNLNEQRTQDILTDITITSGSKNFRAHKAVLAACSSYFAAMFTSGFQESTSPEVVIEEGTSNVLEQLIDFAYTGVLELNQYCVVDVLTMASYLQMKTVVSACVQYLKDKIQNGADVTWADGLVFQIYIVALQHEMSEVKDLCWDLIISDFVVLSKTAGFKTYVTPELLGELLERPDLTKPTKQKLPWHLQMSELLGVIPPQAIATLMGKSLLKKHGEDQILEALVVWLEHDWPNRNKHATSLLKKVRLGVVPVPKIQKVYETSKLKKIPGCNELLRYFLKQDGAEGGMSLTDSTAEMSRSRGTITALIATGGTRIGSDGPFARYFYFNNPDIDDVTWIPLLKLPKPTGVPNIQDHTMVTLEGKLYLAGGGRHNLGPTRTMLDTFYQYNPSQNSWIELTPMLCGREGCAMVILNSMIYAIGGWDEDGELRIYTEIYDTNHHTWDEREEYIGACDPFAVVFKGKILMYGHGVNDGLMSDNAYYYEDDDEDDGMDEFERYAAEMAIEDQREVRTSMHTLQMYDPESKKWFSLLRKRHHVHTAHGDNEQYSALVVRNDKCYCVIYDKVREKHCWISKPRVHELILELESSAPSAKLGKEEEQPWLPEYHVPGAFCIDREIYVNVNGCIINTGQKMATEKPIDGVNFSRWLSVDSPEMANSAVALYSFDHYDLT